MVLDQEEGYVVLHELFVQVGQERELKWWLVWLMFRFGRNRAW